MYKFKQFKELEDVVEWLNSLHDNKGVTGYEVDSIYSTPSGVFIVLHGDGEAWSAL